MDEISNNYNQNYHLNDIKSNYILKKIFCQIKIKKLLEIIRNNKNLQNRLNKDINDYKEYLQIEIEVIPEENNYGKFINIEDNDKCYYHIYFNDNKEDINKNSINENDKVSKIKIIIDYEIKYLNKLFKSCLCLKKINIIKCKRKDIKIMKGMFIGCSNLEEVNLSKFKFNIIKDMSYMFKGCSKLKKLNIINFKANNLTNMSCMFKGCSSLNKIKTSNKYIQKIIEVNNLK